MNGRLARLSPVLAPLLAPLGGLLVWLAERIWPGTAASPYLAGAGAAALVAALLLHLPPFQERRATRSGRAAAAWLAAPHALFVVALAFYYAGRALHGAAGAVDWQALATGGWIVSATVGAVLFLFVTLARLAQRHTPDHDPRRLRAAGSAGLSLGLLLVLVALLNFIFARLPWQWDLAYFKTTRPSAATLEVVRGLADPVDVAVFFPADSELAPLVRSYFDALRAGAGSSDKLRVQFADADLQPALAEDFKARGNGWVVLRKAEVLRPVRLGDTLERARGQLRTLDRTVFVRLLELARPAAVVYLTAGHGERTERVGAEGPGGAFTRFRSELRDRNYTVRDLGIAQGLGDRVPPDAALVVSVAPREPFLPNEAESLRRYLAGGGRLLAFLEPVAPARRSTLGTALQALLQDYGVQYDPVPQANDHIYARRTFTKADRTLLVTIAYQNHPSVNTLRRAAGQFPLLLLGAGALSAGTAPPGLVVTETIRAMSGTWGDRNGDFEFDPKTERRGEPALALAVSPRPQPALKSAAAPGAPGGKDAPPAGPTLLVFADADLASDLLMQNRANVQAVDDALSWLVQRETPAGPPESEEDVRIQHAKSDDWLWFYLPVLGVPALLLGLGAFRINRQRRRAGRSDA